MQKKNSSVGLEIGDLQVNRKTSFRSHKKTLTLSPKFFKREDQIKFFKIESERVNKYKESKRYHLSQDDKWDVKLQTYMTAKQKISDYFNKKKNFTPYFEHFKLDKRHEIQQKKKASQLRHVSPEINTKQQKKEIETVTQKEGKQEKNAFQKSFYVSNLIVDEDQKRKTFRCDALMVNLVSNYFRRKMFKKHRKYDSIRVKTEGNMVNFSGEEVS